MRGQGRMSRERKLATNASAASPQELPGTTSRGSTMAVYWPKGRNRGVAVIVFPGGRYQILAMDF
jgi:hypothetical protein